MKDLADHSDRTRRHQVQPQHTRSRNKAAKKALFITCTEVSFAPANLTRIGPEVLFEVRNLGNIVPKNQANVISSDMAAIEYSLQDPNLRDVIVCGHSGCTAVAYILDRRNTSVPRAVKRWLFTADSRAACENAVGKGSSGSPSQAQIDKAARAHLAVQATNLLDYATVVKGRASGALRLHSWFYNEAGRVEALPMQGYFRSRA